MSVPIRKYDLVVNIQKDKEKKPVWKNIGNIAVWATEEGGERLSTQLHMFPWLNIATFLQKPREDIQHPSQQGHPSQPQTPVANPEPEQEVDVEDIPF